MSELHAFRQDDIPMLAPAMRPDAIGARATHGVAVEIADAARLTPVRAAWLDLLGRADAPNVFMDPALVQVAAGIDPEAHHRALLAWKQIDGERQLVGVWAVSIGRAAKSTLPLRVVNAPPHAHGHLATPVIDRDCLVETLDAMLDAIADDAEFPNIIALEAMATDTPTYAALARVLADRGSAPCVFEEFRRPKLQSDADGKSYLEQALSSSSRKKLRQHRRRLSEQGALSSSVTCEPGEVRRALEQFLTMEAAGWKGRQGTAFLQNANDAAFMRGAVAALADLGCASIHVLHLDGKPVSMQIVARSGPAAFTWKTTYDEQFRDYSPGMLLFEDYTAAFLADKTIAFVDSCSHDETSFMSAWAERQTVADLWIEARRGGSLTFRALGGLQRNYRELRAGAKSAYLALRQTRKR